MAGRHHRGMGKKTPRTGYFGAEDWEGGGQTYKPIIIIIIIIMMMTIIIIIIIIIIINIKSSLILISSVIDITNCIFSFLSKMLRCNDLLEVLHECEPVSMLLRHSSTHHVH
jgi:hypothetical protein